MKKIQTEHPQNPLAQREEFLEFQTTALPLEAPLGPNLTDALSVKPIIQTQWRKVPRRFQKDLLPSMTVPGQSQKLSKLMAKYKVGIPPIGYRPIYSENVDADMGKNPKALDYVDIQNLSNENLKRINALEKERLDILESARKEQIEKQKAQYEKELREKIAAENAAKH